MSFDCEGKWGLADNITDYDCQILADQNLNKTYQRLLDIINRHDLKATFAFVGAFMMSVDEYMSKRDWFHDIPINGVSWLARFNHDARDNSYDGWLNPVPFEIIRQQPQHEIASHGFTHLLLDEDLISEKSFLLEIQSISELSRLKDIPFKTFVYPRNFIGYPDLLGRAGFIGYRDGIAFDLQKGRIQKLLGELNIKQDAQAHAKSDHRPVKIPSGYFLNWRAHLRRLVPFKVTLQRWRHAIDSAIKNRGVIHLSSHPQDFIDGHNQYALLDKILSYVTEKCRQGHIQNLTQYEYSKAILQNE